MACTLVVAETLIIVPHLDLLVLSTRSEVLAFFCDCQSVDLSWVRTIKHSDCLAIEAVPIGDFPVRTSCQELGLVWMVDDLLKHGWFKEAHNSSVALDVPNDAWAIIAGTHCLSIILVNFYISNSSSVFLQWGFHHLSWLSDSPNPNLTFHTTRYYSLAVVGWA